MRSVHVGGLGGRLVGQTKPAGCEAATRRPAAGLSVRRLRVAVLECIFVCVTVPEVRTDVVGDSAVGCSEFGDGLLFIS